MVRKYILSILLLLTNLLMAQNLIGVQGNTATVLPISSLIDGTVNYLPKFASTNSVVNSNIFDNGNIGIGTTSPTQRLDVAGGGRFTGLIYAENNNGEFLRAINGGANALALRIGNLGGDIYFGKEGATGGAYFTDALSYGSVFYGIGTTFQIIINGTSRIAVLQNGNVGIGTKTPSERLDISGNIKSSGSLQVGNLGANIKDQSNQKMFGSDGSQIVHYIGAGGILFANQSGNGYIDIAANGDISTSSKIQIQSPTVSTTSTNLTVYNASNYLEKSSLNSVISANTTADTTYLSAAYTVYSCPNNLTSVDVGVWAQTAIDSLVVVLPTTGQNNEHEITVTFNKKVLASQGDRIVFRKGDYSNTIEVVNDLNGILNKLYEFTETDPLFSFKLKWIPKRSEWRLISWSTKGNL